MFIQHVLYGLLAAGPLQHAITVLNNCPASINLFVDSFNLGSLKPGMSTTRNFPGDWDGFVSATVDGENGQLGSDGTRAGFHLKGDNGYYFTIVDPTSFDVGLSIWPGRPQVSGFCDTASCESLSCSAFRQTPTVFPSHDPYAPPDRPLFACPGADTAYTVTFCPSGNLLASSSKQIHPNGNSKKCLDVRGGVLANGTPVQIYDCNGTAAQRWKISRGNTKVQLVGSNFCLDAGSIPGDGVGMKIWECFKNLPAQAWYYTDDNRIALTGKGKYKGQCLDLPDGSVTNGNQVQTWKCTDFNTNQIWTL